MDDGVADEPVDESAEWRSWLSIGVDFIPVVGNIKSAIEAATGRDFIAGEDLGALERAAATAGIFAGGLSKTAAKGAIAGAGAVAEVVARRAAKNADIVVLGRQVDTAVAKDWPGHKVLDVPDWSLKTNDDFIRGIIDNRGQVYLGSPQNRSTLWDAKNNRPTVFVRELEQLRAAYRQVGDYMVPPPTP